MVSQTMSGFSSTSLQVEPYMNLNPGACGVDQSHHFRRELASAACDRLQCAFAPTRSLLSTAPLITDLSIASS
jgi:hypothetical protein